MPNTLVPDAPNTGIERLARVEAHMETVRTDVGSLERTQQQVMATVNKLDASSETQNRQLTAIAAQLAEISRNWSSVSGLGDRISMLEAKTAAMEAQLQSLVGLTALGRGAWFTLLRLGALVAGIAGVMAAIGPWFAGHVKFN